MISVTVLTTNFIILCTTETQPEITHVKNISEQRIIIEMLQRRLFEQRATEQLKKPIKIPFISAKEHWDDFVADRPYFPENALTVQTKLGLFAIWKDETGIMCARKYVPGTCSTDTCKPIALRHMAQTLTLLIDRQGSPKLECS